MAWARAWSGCSYSQALSLRRLWTVLEPRTISLLCFCIQPPTSVSDLFTVYAEYLSSKWCSPGVQIPRPHGFLRGPIVTQRPYLTWPIFDLTLCRMLGSVPVGRWGRGSGQLQTLGLGSALGRIISAVEAARCSLTTSPERCSSSHPISTQELRVLRRKVVMSLLCCCVRDVNPCVNESLPLSAFLRAISERVVYFLFVKAWFHHLPGREIGCSFNF